MSIGNFTEKGFIREGGSISFQERAVQPSDFTQKRGYEYAQRYFANRSSFFSQYPNWQNYADCFIMRRAVIHITGSQNCATGSFRASDLKLYQEPGFQSLKNFRIPGSDRGSIPHGKYQLISLSFRDNGNQTTSVQLHYVQYGQWELVRLTDDLPEPEFNIS